jgi:hypothetical protein
MLGRLKFSTCLFVSIFYSFNTSWKSLFNQYLNLSSAGFILRMIVVTKTFTYTSQLLIHYMYCQFVLVLKLILTIIFMVPVMPEFKHIIFFREPVDYLARDIVFQMVIIIKGDQWMYFHFQIIIFVKVDG